MPSTMAWAISRAINHSVLVGLEVPGQAGGRGNWLASPAGSARPGWLRGDDRHRDPARRQHLDVLRAVALPLEDEGGRVGVLTERVELHRALDGLQRGAAVQVGDDLGVVDGADCLDRLVNDLAD